MILDDILKNLYIDDPFQKKGYEILTKSKYTICKIQNVADYFYSVSDNDFKSGNMDKDFPNIAPPWECFWMEYTFPRNVKIGKKIWSSDRNVFPIQRLQGISRIIWKI